VTASKLRKFVLPSLVSALPVHLRNRIQATSREVYRTSGPALVETHPCRSLNRQVSDLRKFLQGRSQEQICVAKRLQSTAATRLIP
jgi:hypothetical protein